ncbi:cell division control protein 14, SIN component-domain-containing protein [Mucidula mucida]|nr:cell division control protein 14, SIN component-domain-containing protein [Mucidula mucida]
MTSIMDEQFTTIRNLIQEALDEILSPRSASAFKTAALKRLERHLADYVQRKEALDLFVALQHTFECNIPARLLPWVASATQKLRDRGGDADDELASQITLSLSLIQGIAMLHPPTKDFLGRRYSLEIIIDLLLESRHVPSTEARASPSKTTEPSPLTSVVLDALLCMLVDSPPALRVFEDCSGVQAIVKILKRAGTPRQVRMKCLEFLYFYLLDEASPSQSQQLGALRLDTPPSTPMASIPSTPMRAPSKKPYINATPNRPMSRYGSSAYSVSNPGSVFSDGHSSRSSSASSAASSNSTAPSSTESSPKKEGSIPLPPVAPRSLRMLKEVEFVPESPLKGPGGRARPSRHLPSKSLSGWVPRSRWIRNPRQNGRRRGRLRRRRRFGNDAGECVRKAGIWGLAN